jgi:KDO2-lipid IV(A) lauroyltransferase
MLYSLKVGSAIAKYVPRKILLTIANTLGNSIGFLPLKMIKKIESVQSNISPELTNKRLKQRARNVLGYYAQYWIDVFWISTPRTKEDLKKIVRIEGLDNFKLAQQKATDRNGGVILALAHLGSFELAGAWLASTGERPLVVAERLKPPELFELFERTRNVAGLEVIAHDDNPTTKLITGLKEGRVVCLVADRDIAKSGQAHSFFDKEKLMPQGPATLAYLTKSSIVPVATYLNHDSSLSIIFYPECEMVEAKTKKESIFLTTKLIVKSFEDMISRDPAQYHVLVNEWS